MDAITPVIRNDTQKLVLNRLYPTLFLSEQYMVLLLGYDIKWLSVVLLNFNWSFHWNTGGSGQ